MIGKHAAHYLLPAALAMSACGGSTATGHDPQAPAPANPKNAASAVVICPAGSTYVPARNACVATSGTSPSGNLSDDAARKGKSQVRVSCSFRNAWVAVVPEDQYPDDDEYIMQALIGFTEEPDFWADQSEYRGLAKHAAKRCPRRAERFDLPAGSYFVLVGEAGSFGRRGGYRNNGYRRRVEVSPGETLNLEIGSDDLNHTWYCISCPYVSFFDPRLGRYLPAFVILAYRDEPDLRGTDRIVTHGVPVQDGKIRLRVNEVEAELSYLDQLVLEVDGVRVTPKRGGAQSALAAADGIDVVMSQGTEIMVEYEVPHVQGPTATVTVIAHGHYEPVPPGT